MTIRSSCEKDGAEEDIIVALCVLGALVVVVIVVGRSRFVRVRVSVIDFNSRPRSELLPPTGQAEAEFLKLSNVSEDEHRLSIRGVTLTCLFVPYSLPSPCLCWC